MASQNNTSTNNHLPTPLERIAALPLATALTLLPKLRILLHRESLHWTAHLATTQSYANSFALILNQRNTGADSPATFKTKTAAHLTGTLFKRCATLHANGFGIDAGGRAGVAVLLRKIAAEVVSCEEGGELEGVLGEVAGVLEALCRVNEEGRARGLVFVGVRVERAVLFGGVREVGEVAELVRVVEGWVVECAGSLVLEMDEEAGEVKGEIVNGEVVKEEDGQVKVEAKVEDEETKVKVEEDDDKAAGASKTTPNGGDARNGWEGRDGEGTGVGILPWW